MRFDYKWKGNEFRNGFNAGTILLAEDMNKFQVWVQMKQNIWLC